MSLNIIMFIVEIVAGFASQSVSLLADSLDFGGDAANYAISLFVLNRALTTRARASLLKAVTMAGFGIWIIGTTVYRFATDTLPAVEVMGVIGLVALIVNGTATLLLYRFRQGDSNMLSVWLCSRNDALGNIAVMLAALGVSLTHSNIPDLLVALVMGILGLTASVRVARQACKELRSKSHAA